MGKRKLPRWDGLKSLARIRRNALKALDGPAFSRHEIPLLEAAGLPPGEYRYVRGRGNRDRYFKVTPETPVEVEWLMFLLVSVDMAAGHYIRLRKQGKAPESIDDLALRCLWIGSRTTALDIKFDRKKKSKPKGAGRKVLTDPAEQSLAEQEIRKMMRSTVSFTAACSRASMALLRDHKIKASGKTLGRKFAHLNPDNKVR